VLAARRAVGGGGGRAARHGGARHAGRGQPGGGLPAEESKRGRERGGWVRGVGSGAVGLRHPQDYATGEGLLHFATRDAVVAGAPTVAVRFAFSFCILKMQYEMHKLLETV
jgi:hypothetical protein